MRVRPCTATALTPAWGLARAAVEATAHVQGSGECGGAVKVEVGGVSVWVGEQRVRELTRAAVTRSEVTLL